MWTLSNASARLLSLTLGLKLVCSIALGAPAPMDGTLGHSIVPEVQPAFLNPNKDVESISLLSERLQGLGLRPTVFPYTVQPEDQARTARVVHGILHADRHAQSLLYLGPSGISHKYAFVLPDSPLAHEVAGNPGDASNARMALITVYHHHENSPLRPSTIDLNGFAVVENIEHRSNLRQRILAAGGASGGFSHELGNLLRGRIPGF